MYKIVSYEEVDKLKFYEFLKDEYTNSSDPAKNNMWNPNWNSSINYSLPFILEKKNRFKYPNGEFHILFHNDNIIGCGGIYKSEFNNKISLAGCRVWINKFYRNKNIHRDFTLVKHKEWSIKNGCKIIALTFNEYNKNLIFAFKRNRIGETNSIISSRTDKNLFYNNINEVKFPVKIQNTKQWVIYELLDENFYFDWSTIKWVD